MPSRYNTYNSQLKISATGARPKEKSGSHGTITIKQSFTGTPLPGPASHNFAAAKSGYREVNGYAAYNGLSKGSGSGNFIQKAIKHPGAFSKKAKSAGMSTQAYAQKKASAGGTTGRQARLALTLSKLRNN